MSQIILVGHDLGGLSVTYAMEHFHDKISVAVFLAAMMLPSGYPLTFDVRFLPPTSPPPSLLSSKAAVSVGFHMVVHTIGSYI
jgi:alpha-beta hydrolase superfamily lysophospholipase